MHHAFWIGVVALIFIVLYRAAIADMIRRVWDRVIEWWESTPGMVILVAAIALAATSYGCGSPLQQAATVANGAAEAGKLAAEVLDEQCVAPMVAAAKRGDVEAASRLAVKCDPAMLAYEALRLAHVALRAGIVAAAADGDLGRLAPLVAEVAAAAIQLGQDIDAVRSGKAPISGARVESVLQTAALVWPGDER